MRWASIENPSANNFFIKFVMKYKKTKVSHDFSFIFQSKYMLKMVCSFFFYFFFLNPIFFFFLSESINPKQNLRRYKEMMKNVNDA